MEFGCSWAKDKDECDDCPEPPINPCDTNRTLAALVEDTCSIFDPNANGGKNLT